MRWLGLLAAGACQVDPYGPEPGQVGPGPDDSGPPPEVPVSTEPSARLHEQYGSLVYASWSQDQPGTRWIEYSFDEGVWVSSPARDWPAGRNEQLLVGIPYESEVRWRVVGEQGVLLEGPPQQTGAYPSGLPRPTVVTSVPELQLPEGRWLLTSLNASGGGWRNGTYWTVLWDRQGRLVWAQRTPGGAWTLFAQLGAAGDRILWDEQTKWRDWDEGRASRVHATWLDQEIEVIATPGLHHPFVQLPDGTLAWGSHAHGDGEALVEKIPGQDELTVRWTCLDDWSGAGLFCESNGLFYDETRDSYLMSFFSNSSLVEIDRSEGQTLWWAGELSGGFTFSPPDATFSWQHGLSWTEAGTLLLSSEYGDPEETWLLEYEVDPIAGELALIWSDSAEIRASTGGQAWRLANGNTLHLLGSAGQLREVSPSGEDVWRLDLQGDYLLGHGQFLSDLYALVAPATEE